MNQKSGYGTPEKPSGSLCRADLSHLQHSSVGGTQDQEAHSLRATWWVTRKPRWALTPTAAYASAR